MSTASRRRPSALGLVAAVLTAVAVAGCLPGTLANRGSTVSASADAAVAVTPAPASATPAVSSSAARSQPPAGASPTPPPPTAAPSPTPTPAPAKVPVDVNLVANPADHFLTEIRKTWCAASGTQMVIALNGRVALTAAAQGTIFRRGIDDYWSWSDSHNRGWGPAMIAKVLAAYGVRGYEVRVYKTRAAALVDAARAIERTRQPAVLLVWRGAHTWVMAGFRATADPVAFPDAKVTGAYILDPWYPRVSSIWGRSDPPGTFQDAKEMVRNYLPWKRPEGRYPARDGQFIAVVPTLPRP